MSLIYDGALSDQIVDYIKTSLNKYSQVIEITSLPDNMSEWVDKNLPLLDTVGEDCNGNTVFSKSSSWGLVTKDLESSKFLFFNEVSSKNKFCEDFPDRVISKNPFKTLL